MNEGNRQAPVPTALPGSYVPPSHPLPPVGPGPGQGPGPFLGQEPWMGGPPPPPYSMIPGSCPPEFTMGDPMHPSSFNQNFAAAPPPPSPHGFLHPHHHHPHHHPFDPRTQQPLFPKAIGNSPGFGAAPFSTNSPFSPHLPCPPPPSGYNSYVKGDRLTTRSGPSDPSASASNQEISPEGLTARLLDKTSSSNSDGSMATPSANSREGTPGNSVGYRPWEQAGGQDPHSVQPPAQPHTPQGIPQEMSHAQRPPSAQPDKTPATPESMSKSYGSQEFAQAVRGPSSGESTHGMNSAPSQFSSGPSPSDNTQQDGMQSVERMPTPVDRDKYQPHPNTQFGGPAFQSLSSSQQFVSSSHPQHHMSYHPGQQVNSGFGDSKQMKIVEADSSSSSSDVRGSSENYQVPSTSPVGARSSLPPMSLSHGADHWESANAGGGQPSMPGQENEKVTKKKRKRCGECPGCLKKDNCGECGPCKSVRSHQICKMRKCDQLKTKKEKEQDSSWLFGTGKRHRKSKCASSGSALSSTKERHIASTPVENSPMDGGGGNCLNGGVQAAGPTFQPMGAPENQHQNLRQPGVPSFSSTDFNLPPPQHKVPASVNVPPQGSPGNHMFEMNPHFSNFPFSQQQQQQQQQQQHIPPYNGHIGHESVRPGPPPGQMPSEEVTQTDAGTSRHQMMHHRLKSLIQSRQTQKDQNHGGAPVLPGRYQGHSNLPSSGPAESQVYMSQQPQTVPCPPPPAAMHGPLPGSSHSVNHHFANHQVSPAPPQIEQGKQHNAVEQSWSREAKSEQAAHQNRNDSANSNAFEQNGSSTTEEKNVDATDRPFSREGENRQTSGFSVQGSDQQNDPMNGINYSAFYSQESAREGSDGNNRETFSTQGPPGMTNVASSSSSVVHQLPSTFASQSAADSQSCNSHYMMAGSGAYPTVVSSHASVPTQSVSTASQMQSDPSSRTEHLTPGYAVRSRTSPSGYEGSGSADTRVADVATSGNGPGSSGGPAPDRAGGGSENAGNNNGNTNNEESIDSQPFLSNTTTSMNTYTSIINSFNLTSPPYLSFTSSKLGLGPSVIASVPPSMSSPEPTLTIAAATSSSSSSLRSDSNSVTASPLTGGDSANLPSVDGGRIRDSAPYSSASYSSSSQQQSSLPPLTSANTSTPSVVSSSVAPPLPSSSASSSFCSAVPTVARHSTADCPPTPTLPSHLEQQQGWWERLERLRNNVKMEVPPCDCFGEEEREYPSLSSPTLPTLPATL